MYDNKNNRISKIILIILSIGLVVSAVVSVTYALFSGDVYASNYDVYSTGFLSIEANSKSNNISLTNTIPLTDEDGISSKPYIFTITNNGNLDYKFNVQLLTNVNNGDNTFAPQYVKIKVDDNNVTTLYDLGSYIKSDIVLAAGESIDISLRIWLSVDEDNAFYNTPNSEIGKSFESEIIISGVAVHTSSNEGLSVPTVASLDDFTYVLGSNVSSVNYISYFYKENDTYYDIPISPILLEENEVLLMKYNGSLTDIIIPDTYVFDGVTYNVVLLSGMYNQYFREFYTEIYDITYGVFQNNTNITSVQLGDNIKTVYSDVNGTYFDYAKSLFYGCTNLITVSNIPSSVTSIDSMFYGCSNLIFVPEIPNLVNSMYETFYGCTSLGGVVKIRSNIVDNADNVFSNTVNDIEVKVPSSSNTYNTFNELTVNNGMPNNVVFNTY